jgi:hypothetical protein
LFSHTIAALERFDNQHDFERMSADILNALSYKGVILIAPRGGSDGGRDIIFTTESGGKGLGCVTLRKDIDAKFKEDFFQHHTGDFEKYILFCTAYLTADQKRRFAEYCLISLKAEFLPQDIEALRSLLDNPLKSIRAKYLDIQENKKIRQKVKRILFNPLSEVEAPEPWCAIALAAELDMFGLYKMIKDEDISTIAETQQEQDILNSFIDNFIQLQKVCIDIDNYVSSSIGIIIQSSYDITWDATHQYMILRLFGWKKEKTEERTVKRIWYITNPDFNTCERVYEILYDDQTLQLLMQNFKAIYQEYTGIRKAILELDGFKLADRV